MPSIAFISTMDAVDEYALSFAGGEWVASGNAEALPWATLPFSSALAPLLGTLFYVSLHVVLGRLVTEENKLQLTPLMAAYNFALAASSAVLFGVLTWSVWGVYSEYGFEGVWNDPNWILPSTNVGLCCYLFYVSKYVELLDTAFLLLRNKPVRFVQKWHHVSVLYLFWSYMQARMLNHWVLVWANTFAHIFVYGYFFCATMKIEVGSTFKSAITIIQIGQFVLDMLYSLPFPIYKMNGTTKGEWGPWIMGQFIGFTFIVLFSRVYLQNKEKARLRKLDGKGKAVQTRSKKEQ